MVRDYSSILKRAAASVCAAALLVATPGIGAWEAVAQVVPIHVNAPLGGGAGIGAAGAGVRGPVSGASIVSPIMGLPVIGMPGLAPTVTPEPRLSAPVPGGLPASSIPGAARITADPFARFAQPGPIAVEGRNHPEPPAPGGAEAASALAGSPSAGSANSNLGKVEADGLPSELPESVGAFRGKGNGLGRQFNALRAAFGMRADADFSPVNGVRGELRPGVGSQSNFSGVVKAYFQRPLSAARGGLARFIGRSSSAPAPLAPPTPLTLSTSRDGLKLSIAAAGPVNAVAAPEADPADAAAPTPSAAPAPAPVAPQAGWFGLGKVAMMFIAALVVAQVGVEALGSAMPTLVQTTFGDFTAVAQLAIFSSVASIIGRQFGPMVVRRFGLKTSYLSASALRLVSISTLAALLATGNMTLPLMMAFYSLNGLLSGISLTAMESIAAAVAGKDQARIERFWAWEQTILEIVGIAGPIATGAIVASFGFLPALIAFPVTMAISLAIVLTTLKLPKLEPEALEKGAAQSATTKGFWGKVFYGAQLVWGTPVLRYSFLGFTAFMMLNPFLYTMLGPAYGIALLGPENAQAATSVIGWLTGLFSLGGLLGGFMMMWEQKRTAAAKAERRAEHEAKSGKLSDEAWAELARPWENEVLRKSMLRWMLWGTVGLAGIAAMALPVPMLGTFLQLPAALSWLGSLTLPALTLIPFGLAQVVAVLKLRSYFQSQVPDPAKNMPDAMGFFGSASLAVTTSGLLALKWLFQSFTGLTPFVYIAAALLPLAAVYLFLRWRLDHLSKPS
ncbi:MAG: hypothetical protein HYZ75_09145 [Elusimicrobia bacterium]|nr:hypothetical protein [Elusimicrobiota bacterium]